MQLVYVSDDMPGIRRVRRGAGFAYRSSQGRWLADDEEIARIKRLAIPPAYSDVWICPLENGHLQATGRDARGRKQYRYHPQWQSKQNDAKFERLLAFGRALPRIRARVARELKQGLAPRTEPSQRLVLATLVRLLDTTLVRIGNDEYARSNESFGLTTLRNPHARVRGTRLRLCFRGKSGVAHDVTVTDARLARIVRRCQDLPGQELFQYVDAEGEVHRVSSTEVNAYIADAAGTDEHFTAKDFRTWHASAIALQLTCGALSDGSFAAKPVLAEVAARLRNTPAVCRGSYVHPKILDLWKALEGKAAEPAAMMEKLCAYESSRPRMPASEQRLLAFLTPARRTRKPA